MPHSVPILRNYVKFKEFIIKKHYIKHLCLQGETNEKEENIQQNGKRDYVQTLKYFPDPKHNGHDIKCQVEHSAYTEATLSEGRNEVSRKLELYCKFIF